MWAKLLGMVVVAIGLGSVGAYYAFDDVPAGAGDTQVVSGSGCPLTGGCSSTTGCASEPTCCEEHQTAVTDGAAVKSPSCEGK